MKKLFRKLAEVFNPPLFNSKGVFNVNRKNARCVDALLIILAASPSVHVNQLHREMWSCGFRIQYPELLALLRMLNEEGLIKYKCRNL